MKRLSWWRVERPEHDGPQDPAGEDVDGAELVHLAHALELADVEPIHETSSPGHLLARQNPKGSSSLGRLGRKVPWWPL